MEKYKIGYFSSQKHDEQYIGGVMITDNTAIPIEFKYTESINKYAVRQGIMYDHLYRQQRDFKDETEFDTVLVSSHTPRRKVLRKAGFEAGESPGIYQSDISSLDCLTIIALNELPDTPNNAVLKCFASRQQEKKKAFQMLSHRLTRMPEPPSSLAKAFVIVLMAPLLAT